MVPVVAAGLLLGGAKIAMALDSNAPNIKIAITPMANINFAGRGYFGRPCLFMAYFSEYSITLMGMPLISREHLRRASVSIVSISLISNCRQTMLDDDSGNISRAWRVDDGYAPCLMRGSACRGGSPIAPSSIARVVAGALRFSLSGCRRASTKCSNGTSAASTIILDAT